MITTRTFTQLGFTFALGAVLLLPTLVFAQENSSTSTVELTISKFISGSSEGYALSDFAYQVTGNGVNEVVPHGDTIALGIGTYSIEELVPNDFVKEDWRVGWYGDCDNGSGYSTTITIDEGNVDHGFLSCQADNQYRPAEQPIPGCTDSNATNYDPAATEDDGSCTYSNGQQYVLEGYVWHDEDEDGVIDEDEDRLEDWLVVLTDDEQTSTTSSDANGYYSFNVSAGTYTLSEQVEEGWEQVFPTPVTHTVTVPTEATASMFPLRWLIATAHAQVQSYGPFNFGNVLNGNGGGGNNFSCSLTASDTNVDDGEQVELNWDASGASTVSIDNGVGSTTAVGTTSVVVTNDITYTLTAFDGTATTTCAVSIDVDTTTGGGGSSGPYCQAFSVSDTTYRSGETYTLSWSTRRGSAMNITANGAEIFATTTDDTVDDGTLTVSPTEPTTYELMVERGSRDDTCSVTIGRSSSGGGGGSPSGTGGDPQVLGEQVSMIPYGAPNAGFVGGVSALQAYFALGGFLTLVVVGMAWYRRYRRVSM